VLVVVASVPLVASLISFSFGSAVSSFSSEELSFPLPTSLSTSLVAGRVPEVFGAVLFIDFLFLLRCFFSILLVIKANYVVHWLMFY